jgi:biotin/methionine sulfoxide reductase
MKTRRSASHWGAFSVDLEDGKIVGVRPFEHDPQPSRLNEAWPEMITSPLRVKRPAFRKGWLEGDGGEGRGDDSFVEVSWDEALDRVAGELKRVVADHGASAIFGGSYGWSSAGRVHHARTLVQRFLGCLGGFTGQVTNYSYGAAMAFLPRILGTNSAIGSALTAWDSIEEHCDIFLAFGGIPRKNWEILSGGVSQHLFDQRMDQLKDGKVRFVNISPTRLDAREDTVDHWLPIRPNTDTALLLACCHELASTGTQDQAFLDRYCFGYETFEAYLLGRTDGVVKDAAWASNITGIDVDTINTLAKSLVGKRVMISATWSLQRARHGEQPYWAIVALAAMLGQIGLPGAGFAFGYGSSNGMGNARFDAPLVGLADRTLKPGMVIPVARVSDLLLNPGDTFRFNGETLTYPDTKLIYWAGGNPFHHHQDLNRLREAFRQPEVVIVNENYWTATARHADIVLPATIPLERNDIGGASRERYILAMQKVCEPFEEARNDFDIFADLAKRLGVADTFTECRGEDAWLRWSWQRTRDALAARDIETPDFDGFWEQGFFEVPEPKDEFVMFEAYRADPDANPLRTPSGRIELFSEAIKSSCGEEQPGHAAWLDPEEWLGSPLAARHPLHLLTPQPERRLHGQMDASAFNRAGKTKDREPVVMNSADAEARGIKTGDIVRIFNDRGACLAAANVGDDILPGAVSLATGATFDPDGKLDRHSNPNVLTRDIGTSEIGQGCSAQSCLVEIERYDGILPAVRIFEPPTFVARSVSSVAVK